MMNKVMAMLVAVVVVVMVATAPCNAQDSSKMRLFSAVDEKLLLSEADKDVLEEVLESMEEQSMLTDDETALMGRIEDLLLHLRATKPFVDKNDKKTIKEVILRVEKQLQAASPENREPYRKKSRLLRALKARTDDFQIHRMEVLPPAGPPRR